MSEQIKINNNEISDKDDNTWGMNDTPSWDEIKEMREKNEKERKKKSVYWINDKEVEVSVDGESETMSLEEAKKKYEDDQDLTKEIMFLEGARLLSKYTPTPTPKPMPEPKPMSESMSAPNSSEPNSPEPNSSGPMPEPNSVANNMYVESAIVDWDDGNEMSGGKVYDYDGNNTETEAPSWITAWKKQSEQTLETTRKRLAESQVEAANILITDKKRKSKHYPSRSPIFEVNRELAKVGGQDLIQKNRETKIPIKEALKGRQAQ